MPNKLEKKNILFVIMVYISFITFLLTNSEHTIFMFMFAISLFFTLILGFWIIISQIKVLLHLSSHLTISRRTKLRKQYKFLKLSLIPFFVINFLYWIILFVVVPMGIIVGIVYLPVVIILTYFVTIVTGIYGLTTIMAYKRTGYLGKEFIIIHLILQFVFVLDIFDTWYLLKKLPKGTGQNGKGDGVF